MSTSQRMGAYLGICGLIVVIAAGCWPRPAERTRHAEGNAASAAIAAAATGLSPYDCDDIEDATYDPNTCGLCPQCQDGEWQDGDECFPPCPPDGVDPDSFVSGLPCNTSCYADLKASYCKWVAECAEFDGGPCDIAGDSHVDYSIDFAAALDERITAYLECDCGDPPIIDMACALLENCDYSADGEGCSEMVAAIEAELGRPMTAAELDQVNDCNIAGSCTISGDPDEGEDPDGDGSDCVAECGTDCGGSGDQIGTGVRGRRNNTGGAGGSGGGGFGNPASELSVDLVYGDKLERATDLVVAMPGDDFVLTREYRSEPGYEAPPLCGEKWSLSIFRYMDVENDEEIIPNVGGPWHPHPLFDGDAIDVDGTPWTPGGSSTQHVEKTKQNVNGTIYPVWRIVEPGQWEMDFYRALDLSDPDTTRDNYEPPTPTAPSSLVEGLLARRADAYGNEQVYSYQELPTSTGTTVRLNEITCGDGTTTYARIQIGWDFGDSGRVKTVEVYRPLSGGGEVKTQWVEYTYFQNESCSTDVGSADDLVQVTKYTRVDPDPGSSDAEWRAQVTQYRYHDSASLTTPIELTGSAFEWVGSDHQLKMVIYPEQIEYACQQEAEDEGSTIYSVEDLAAALLAQDDDEVAWTGGSLMVDLAGKVIETYEASGEKRVLTQYIQAGCGCGGGGSGDPQVHRMTYDYWHTTASPAGSQKWTTEVIEAIYNGSTWDDYRITYNDMEAMGSKNVPYLVNVAIVDAADTDLEWVTRHEYDTDLNLEYVYTPSAMATYTPATVSSDPSYTAKSGAEALIFKAEYNSDSRVTARFKQNGTSGTAEKVMAITYDGSREYLVTKVQRYRVANSVVENEIETTDYVYTFHNSGADDIASIKTTVEAELSTENGPGGSYDSWEFFDTRGLNTWSVDATNCFTKRTFDIDDSGSECRAGRVTKSERNVVKTGAPTGAPSTDRNADGKSLITEYTYDLLGRLQQSETPAGVLTSMRREMRTAPNRPYFEYYARVTLPHELTGGGYNGPASIAWMNASGDTIEGRTYEIDTGGYTDPTGSGYQPIYSDYDLKDGASQHLSASVIVHDIAGLVETSKVWHSVAGDGENSGVYETTYEYDELGRLERTINSNDTVYESVYDVLDRVTESKVGVMSGGSPTSMTTVTAYFYDHDGTTTPSQGIGNGNLTWIRQYTGESSPDDVRDTVHTFDWRDRLIVTENPMAPHRAVAYDNLDRPVKQGVFRDVPPADSTAFSAADSDRGSYTLTEYSQRGLVFRTSQAIDPEVIETSLTFLETNRWFDDVGRTVGTWGPNGPSSKITYDGLGRTSKAFVTDRRTSTTGTYDTAFADIYDATNFEADLDDDAVIEQTEYTYNDDSPATGLLEETTTRRRTHRASTSSHTGDLENVTASKEITTYVMHFYDDAARPTHVANYGTNGTQFEADGTAPSYPSSPPAASDTILVSETSYNVRGLVDVSTAPDGQKTKYVYDDMNRQIAVIEGQVDVIASEIDWDATNSRWECTDDLTVDDEDRVTTFVYDGIGNVIKQVAHLVDAAAGNAVQVTSYDYGVTKGVNTNDDDSLIASNDLLAEVTYPDAQGGASTDTVTYAYNLLGELRFMEDQNETTHVYTRDDLGRVTQDEAAIAMGSNIDDTYDTLTFSYDDLGRLEAAETLAKSGGTISNGVEFEYNGLWQVTKVLQDHDSAVDDPSTTNTVQVQYTYDQSAAASDGSGNYSRLDTLTYPDESEDLEATYGIADRLDDAISRVKGYTLNTTDIIDYDFIGLDIYAIVEYVDPVIELTRYHAHNGSVTDGEYPGMDRFGRVVRQMWTDDGAFTTHATLTTVPAVPPIFEHEYTYDRSSNRTAAYDARPGGQQPLSHEYTYDGLDRLEVADRGSWDGTTFTQASDSQEWALDLLGNWDSFKVDADGNGSYAASETESRLHNEVNELETRTPGTGSAITLNYDGAGNLRTEEVSSSPIKTYTHDPWNRLVKVTKPSVAGEEYEYNALNWRTVKRADTNDSGFLDQERVQYYSADWQLLEERIDDDSPFSGDTDRVMGYVWGSRYIDDIVMRQVDTDNDGTYEDEFFHLTDVLFSTVVITDESGTIEERVSYDAYGTARHHWAEDVDGDGDVELAGLGNTDKDIVNTIAAGGNNLIGQSAYRSEADLDRDGDVDSTDAGLITTAKAALASGEMTDRSAVDNQVGWIGYLYCHDVELHTVRYRHYDPAAGRWVERDPLGTRPSRPNVIQWNPKGATKQYSDGMSLYQYCKARPLGFGDPSGLDTGIIGPESRKERDRRVREQLACRCRQLVQRGLKKVGRFVGLPSCPCQLATRQKPGELPESFPGYENPDPSVWEDPSNRHIEGFHDGAIVCMRSKPIANGAGQQCCYGPGGRLITGGRAAGTPDLYSPSGAIRTFRHWINDVRPYDVCRAAGLLHLYFRVWAPNNGRNCNAWIVDQQ